MLLSDTLQIPVNILFRFKGGYRITPGGYAHMTHMLSSLADGRLIIALEVRSRIHIVCVFCNSCTYILINLMEIIALTP